jgi:hypothetical protein
MKDFSPTTLIGYLKLVIIALLAVMIFVGIYLFKENPTTVIATATAIAVALDKLLSFYGFTNAADSPPGPKVDKDV